MSELVSTDLTWWPPKCGHPDPKVTICDLSPSNFRMPAGVAAAGRSRAGGRGASRPPAESGPDDHAAERQPRIAAAAHATSSPALLDASFADLGVPGLLVGVLAEAGITVPFPIQAATLPDALAGRDILGRGRTGSGKTLGFALPLVAGLADGYTSAGRPRGLVLVPTRELASQVHAVLVPLAQAMDLTVATIFGGTGQNAQVTALRNRVDIVVACPGRLADLIEQGHCHLGDVEISVLDEADHMADLGFLPVVRRLMEATPPESQRMLFSATLDNAVDVLVRRFLSDPAVHAVDSATAAPGAMVHHLLTVAPGDRVGVVAALAGGCHRSLVFTRTKHGAQKLTRQLVRAWRIRGGAARRPRPGCPGSGTWRRLPPARPGSWWPPTSPPAASTWTASAW